MPNTCAHCAAAIPEPLTPRQRAALTRGFPLYCQRPGERSPCQRAAANAREAARYERLKAPQRVSPQALRERRALPRAVRRRVDFR